MRRLAYKVIISSAPALFDTDFVNTSYCLSVTVCSLSFLSFFFSFICFTSVFTSRSGIYTLFFIEVLILSTIRKIRYSIIRVKPTIPIIRHAGWTGVTGSSFTSMFSSGIPTSSEGYVASPVLKLLTISKVLLNILKILLQTIEKTVSCLLNQ